MAKGRKLAGDADQDRKIGFAAFFSTSAKVPEISTVAYVRVAGRGRQTAKRTNDIPKKSIPNIFACPIYHHLSKTQTSKH